MDKLEEHHRLDRTHEKSTCKQTFPAGSSVQTSQHVKLPSCSHVSKDIPVKEEQDLKCDGKSTNEQNVIADSNDTKSAVYECVICNIKIEQPSEFHPHLETCRIAHGGFNTTAEAAQTCQSIAYQLLTGVLVGTSSLYLIFKLIAHIFYN